MKKSRYFGLVSLKDTKKHLLNCITSLVEINRIGQVLKAKHLLSCFVILGVGKHIPKVF